MPDSIMFDLQAEFCHSLSHPTRQRIVHILMDGPMCVNDLSNTTGIKQSVVSRHLSILRQGNVVIVERHGTKNLYRIANQKILELCSLLQIILLEQTALQSLRLKNIQSLR